MKLILAFGNFCERSEIDRYTFPQIYDVTKYVTLAISVCELNQALYFSFTLPYHRLTVSLVAAFDVGSRFSLFLCTKFWLSRFPLSDTEECSFHSLKYHFIYFGHRGHVGGE